MLCFQWNKCSAGFRTGLIWKYLCRYRMVCRMISFRNPVYRITVRTVRCTLITCCMTTVQTHFDRRSATFGYRGFKLHKFSMRNGVFVNHLSLAFGCNRRLFVKWASHILFIPSIYREPFETNLFLDLKIDVPASNLSTPNTHWAKIPNFSWLEVKYSLSSTVYTKYHALLHWKLENSHNGR